MCIKDVLDALSSSSDKDGDGDSDNNWLKKYYLNLHTEVGHILSGKTEYDSSLQEALQQDAQLQGDGSISDDALLNGEKGNAEDPGVTDAVAVTDAKSTDADGDVTDGTR